MRRPESCPFFLGCPNPSSTHAFSEDLPYLAECVGLEATELVLLFSKAALDWFAADFAVFDECLAADG